jgi:hypothetical protein
MSKELIKVQVSSPRESENSIGVFVKLFFDDNGNYSSGTDLQWFPKSQCTLEKIESEDSTKQLPSYFLTAPKWLIDKKIK